MLPADPRTLWAVQLRLESKAVNDGRIVRLPGDNPDEIATCSVVRFVDGVEVVFGEDADEDLIARTSLLASESFFVDPTSTARSIAGGCPTRVAFFHTYAFPETAQRQSADVVRVGVEEYAYIVDGRAVSWASSSRSNSEAAELWVRTEPAFQRRGHGRRVARAWAGEVTSAGKVAFYSHLHRNDSSRRLAAQLGVVHVFDVVAITLDQPATGPTPSGK